MSQRNSIKSDSSVHKRTLEYINVPGSQLTKVRIYLCVCKCVCVCVCVCDFNSVIRFGAAPRYQQNAHCPCSYLLRRRDSARYVTLPRGPLFLLQVATFHTEQVWTVTQVSR